MNDLAKEFYDSDFHTTVRRGIMREFPKWLMAAERSGVVHFRDPSGYAQAAPYVISWIRVVKHGVKHLCVVTTDARFLLCGLDQMLSEAEELNKAVVFTVGSPDDEDGEVYSTAQCIFSGQIYIYSSRVEDRTLIRLGLKDRGVTPYFRDLAYWEAFERQQKRDVMISYNRRDNKLARKLYEQLTNYGLNVWLDEISMKPGDFIVDEIEKATESCRFALVILSPSFLDNSRWCKFEFRNFMLRQVNEDRRVLLPVWKDVDDVMVRSYSPQLANILAMHAYIGVEAIGKNVLDLIEHEKSGNSVTA